MLIDVKTTKQGADQGFHMSLAEVICAAETAGEYRIYRLHGLSDDGATLRISEDIREFARKLLDAHNNGMPEGVIADGFSIAADAAGLVWSDPITLRATDIDEPD